MIITLSLVYHRFPKPKIQQNIDENIQEKRACTEHAQPFPLCYYYFLNNTEEQLYTQYLHCVSDYRQPGWFKVCVQRTGAAFPVLAHPWMSAIITVLTPIPKNQFIPSLSACFLSLCLFPHFLPSSPLSVSLIHTHYIIFTLCDRMNEVNDTNIVIQGYLLKQKHCNTEAVD